MLWTVSSGPYVTMGTAMIGKEVKQGDVKPSTEIDGEVFIIIL